ncbi:MAG: hypothetical protein GTO55_07180 [Armatimonadetes bacterium]|nr:hypothetical protein [Armatimonadota bacterium]NIM24053.1 hypothetical protein [Armatimonadota bacterium]NIM67907.1 hypothetical protein [Armatimonadota bacterium]NIM76429.1 hypothetical protein [Armatimonadota bacterium]NIN06137.1 hypothetical protein [Armatimonadota bacterium]
MTIAEVSALKFLIPIVAGEALAVLANWLGFRPVPLPWRGAPGKLEAAARAGHLQLIGRGPFLCYAGVALHLAVAIAGRRGFENSLVLNACANAPALGFFWGAVLLVLVVMVSTGARELLQEQRRIVAHNIFHQEQITEEDWEERFEEMRRARRRTRGLRFSLTVLGWLIIYLAIGIALVPVV